ncbi:MAG: type II/IV secretion system protein [Deltaproteobacteria bacterium]|nr:type II/IV secretion system protein [Deltaproteobacteria bacterium]
MSLNPQMVERLTDEMVREGLISRDQLSVAQVSHETLGEDLPEILIRKGFISEAEFMVFLAHHLTISYVSLSKSTIDRELAQKVPLAMAKRHRMIPLRKEGREIVVAMSDPLNLHAIEDLRQVLRDKVRPVLASTAEIDEAIQRTYGLQRPLSEVSLELIENVSSEETSLSGHDGKRLEEMATGPRVVQITNEMIVRADQEGASDIHIEPRRGGLCVRYRIDGLLEERQVLASEMHLPIISRIKIISGMDIAERRQPQDGRLRLRIGGKSLDVRVSTYPTLHGEKAVLRLVSSGGGLSIEDLGFSEVDRRLFSELCAQPHGIFLVTGPTGSGKSTTLYAALERLNSPEKNIVSIEDPVEHEVTGVSQAQINLKAGITFASALRAILRQDPDIIMLGEIRDRETAEIAVRAANTGHMVLSTLHTNTTAGTVSRLLDLGVEPFLLSSALVGVLAQRLVRRICPECREEVPPPQSPGAGLMASLAKKYYRGRGCPRCRLSGFSGRVGIFELAPIRGSIRSMISVGMDEGKIEEALRKMGMKTMLEDGFNKVEAGLTTIDEVIRVTKQEE